MYETHFLAYLTLKNKNNNKNFISFWVECLYWKGMGTDIGDGEGEEIRIKIYSCKREAGFGL